MIFSSDDAVVRGTVGKSSALDIPKYWKDRVIVKIGSDNVVVFSKKYPDREILSIVLGSTDAQNLVSPSLLSPAVDLGNGQHAQAYKVDWALKVARVNISHSKSATDYHSLDGANGLVDFQIGGRFSNIFALRDPKTTGGEPDSALIEKLGGSMSDTIPVTITAH